MTDKKCKCTSCKCKKETANSMSTDEVMTSYVEFSETIGTNTNYNIEMEHSFDEVLGSNIIQE